MVIFLYAALLVIAAFIEAILLFAFIDGIDRQKKAEERTYYIEKPDAVDREAVDLKQEPMQCYRPTKADYMRMAEGWRKRW